MYTCIELCLFYIYTSTLQCWGDTASYSSDNFTQLDFQFFLKIKTDTHTDAYRKSLLKHEDIKLVRGSVHLY